eukprot:scaffold76327_cov33-Tisochrysis_lutea.AAC.1
MTSAPEHSKPAASHAAAASAAASLAPIVSLVARGGDSNCKKWLWVTIMTPPFWRHRRSCGRTCPEPGLRARTEIPEPSAPSQRRNSMHHCVCTALGTKISAVLGRVPPGSRP